jgi:hypothetical protein
VGVGVGEAVGVVEGVGDGVRLGTAVAEAVWVAGGWELVGDGRLAANGDITGGW